MELINLKQCNTCNLFEPDVKFCEKRKMCNICRRRLRILTLIITINIIY